MIVTLSSGYFVTSDWRRCRRLHWRDPHFTARKTRQVVDIPFYGPEFLIKAPWRFSSFSPQISRSGPTTGEHNHHVFHDLLGLSKQEIASMEAEGTIA